MCGLVWTKFLVVNLLVWAHIIFFKHVKDSKVPINWSSKSH
jgi:hypothetical protein